jgi:two-component system, chemotaxis family, sensor kinase CheA
MSRNRSNQGCSKGLNTEELRRRIDDLATRCIIGTGRPVPEQLRDLSAAFAAAREQAKASGTADAARIAASLAEAVSGAAADASADLLRLNQTLSAGLADLERAVEAKAQEPNQTAPASGFGVNPIARDPELLNDIILESAEHLASVENELMNIERDPGNEEALHSVFRSFHTIKGLAGFLELAEIQEVAHQVENLLDEARNGKLRITPEIADIVLEGKDYLDHAFQQLSGVLHGKALEPFAERDELLERLRSAASAAPPASKPRQSVIPETASAEPFDTAGASRQAAAREPEPNAEILPQGGHAESRTVKVDTAKLDYLVDMIGELVITESQVHHDPALGSVESPRLQRNLAQLARTTAELQKTGMAMRMVPVGTLFRRMIRLVRDLARKAGKQAEVEIFGEETELDRNIVEELSDPLVHMLRNSLDHGIETPQERLAQGKSRAGHVRMRASHQAGHILIEISDDGRGIDREKVLARARERGLLPEGAHPPDNEVLNLIFEPGFSTAERVTDISGRGVGMDVVRKHVQKLRGRIEIQSVAGQGTTFFLKLPLTLAIIDGLVIGVGRERYIVPLFAVRETFRPKPEMLSTVCGRGEMVLIRGRLLPVTRLSQRFGVKPRTEDPWNGVLIVAEIGGRLFCLMVDDLIGKQEVVVKTLGESLKNIPGVAGGAILGDGRVGLVLDLDGICEQHHG